MSYNDLKSVAKAKLQESGQLSSVKAQLRAQLYLLLSEQHATLLSNAPAKVQQANFVIDELIREYLAFNGLSNTLSVFTSGNYS